MYSVGYRVGRYNLSEFFESEDLREIGEILYPLYEGDDNYQEMWWQIDDLIFDIRNKDYDADETVDVSVKLPNGRAVWIPVESEEEFNEVKSIVIDQLESTSRIIERLEEEQREEWR